MIGSKSDNVEVMLAEDALKIFLKVSQEDQELLGIRKP